MTGIATVAGTSTSSTAPTRSRARIPSTLQAVFLAANRGNNVNKPPPEKVASKTFFRNWFFQRKKGLWSTSGSSTDLDDSKDELTMETGDLKHPRTSKQRISLRDTQPTPTGLTPQGYLDAMIRSRGYSTKRFKALQSAYYNKPSLLQLASYHAYLIDLVRDHNYSKLTAILQVGISPNPCNVHNESLIHTLCRRGEFETLQLFVQYGAVLQVCDDYGRTPLHDACWAANPDFAIVELLLQTDARLLHIVDCRGAVPLSYVRPEQWTRWITFFESRLDQFWPVRSIEQVGEQEAPPLTLQEPHSRPIPDPPRAINPALAAMAASGRMEPYEVNLLRHDRYVPKKVGTKADSVHVPEEHDCVETDDGSSSQDDYSSSSDGDDDDDSCSESTLDEEEMADILQHLQTMNAKPIAWTQS